MEQLEDSDYLDFKSDKSVLKTVNQEKIIFSDKIIKINRYNVSQERNIVITDKAVYNLKKKSKYIVNNNRIKKENSVRYCSRYHN